MKARLPQGMGKGPAGNVNALIREAQKIQEQAEKLQEDLNAREYEVASGGGVCKVKINGKKEILSVSLDPSIVDPDDIETLQDIIVAGVNEAIKRVEKINGDEMEKVTGARNIPGNMF